MLVYLLQLATIPLLALIIKPSAGKSRRRALTYVMLVGLILLGVAALRSVSVGIDTTQFCRAYVRIGAEGFSAFELERYEPLFTLLCLVLNWATNNHQALIAASSAICLIPIFRLIYLKSEDIPFSIFLYIALNLYFSSMNTMRQAIALGVIALALPRLIDGKWLPYVVCVVVATFFHRSALFALLLLPLSKITFTRGTFVAYLAVSAFTFTFSSKITEIAAVLMSREELYSAQFMGSNYFGALLQAAVTFVCCLLCANYFEYSKRIGESKSLDSLYMHAMMLWLLFSVFSMRVEIVGRVESYYSLFAVLAVPGAIKRAPKEERGVIKGAACIAFLTYFIVICIMRPEWSGAIPYSIDFERILPF